MENVTDIDQLINLYILPWGINIVLAIVTFVIGRWVAQLLVNLVIKVMTKAKVDPVLTTFLSSILNAVLLLFIAMASLDQLGVNTTSLLAVFGAAGLAVGLSLQDSLKHFASGVMLIIFRPFSAGDFIEAGGTMGVVEKISVFSTIMRTGDNREVIVPNGAIIGANITNYSARATRRIDMVFGISYGDDIRQAKAVLQRILDEEPRVLKEPAAVIGVSELADSSVNIVVRPWVNTSDYWPVRFDLHERVKNTFDAEGLQIPFPQMDVHLPAADTPPKVA